MRDARGKVRYAKNREGEITVFCGCGKENSKQFFFSTSHMQGYEEGDVQFNEPRNWVPVSSSLPTWITPRPGFPDGMVRTVEEYISVFHSTETEVENPDPSYVPEFRNKKE
jgi:hypothetical protein